ncbi:MAG TPA: PBP1A family penicillin-binding protein [Anaeromyxobacteraceae bacterium]|nr:PBP1A family penicillin-binding protein [Anaeromyxobacteraceae bacterium]
MTPRPKRRRGRRRSRALRITLAATVALLAFVVGGGGLVWASARELPEFDTLRDYRPLVGTRVYGVDGTEVFQFARERRTVIPFGEIPGVMKKAVLASEDAGFYQHEGVNYLAIARCAVKSVLRGQTVCGGSTITQQVVKTFLLTPEKRISRKVKEMLLARRLEQNLSKDEILYLYLNQIYFGHRRYGVEEAARFYFGKGVKDITLGEAAMLAGVVQSPERLSPMKHPRAAKERQKYVLRRMTEEGFITDAMARQEVARPIPVKRPPEDPPGLWYADAVRRLLDEKYGAERVETDGLVVDVAMDSRAQKSAEDALEAQLRAVDRRQGWRGVQHHLDRNQVDAAMPLWRERLQAVEALPGEVLVWDLGRVSADELEPGAESADVRRLASVRRLEADKVYSGLVTAADANSATVDLGGARGVIPLANASWARRFNPVSATVAPKRMTDVLSPGDIAQVRVVSGKVSPAELARSGKLLDLALEQTPRAQGALVAIDPRTRGVVALVGGFDFAQSQFNRALQARRQPGSAFKPFVWGAALESRRFTAATLVYDTPDVYRDPQTGKDWKPQNFERDAYDGPMLLGAALAHSKNTVAVKLLDALGVEAVADFARRMGVTSTLPRQLSLALGTGEVTPLELVNAYATIAAHGFRADPLIVLRVRDRKGQVLEEQTPVEPPPLPAGGAAVVAAVADQHQDYEARPASGSDEPAPVTAVASPAPVPENGCDPAVASVLTSMMRDVVESGTGMGAKALGRPAAAKTGTAQEHRDAWFVGFTPDLVAGAWIGFDTHEPLGPKETGAGAALPAWLAFMRDAQAGRGARDFAVPGTVEYARIDRISGLLAVDPASADAVTLPFVPGTVPTRSAAEVDRAPQNFFME